MPYLEIEKIAGMPGLERCLLNRVVPTPTYLCGQNRNGWNGLTPLKQTGETESRLRIHGVRHMVVRRNLHKLSSYPHMATHYSHTCKLRDSWAHSSCDIDILVRKTSTICRHFDSENSIKYYSASHYLPSHWYTNVSFFNSATVGLPLCIWRQKHTWTAGSLGTINLLRPRNPPFWKKIPSR